MTTQDVLEQAQKIRLVTDEIEKKIVGQSLTTKRLVMALISGGHVLLEGLPGLAKTSLVKTLAQSVSMGFKRIQFTPDLLPADVIGTQIYDPGKAQFQIKKGPVFSNFLLADEINRAPAKVQSALLEAMEEKQVTIGDETYRLPEPFLVMATQNPIEQEGTYPLPEAQMDRFLFKLKVSYGSKEEEVEILNRSLNQEGIQIRPILDSREILLLRDWSKKIYISDKIRKYIVDLIFATRTPPKELKAYIEYGASPRGSLALDQAARVHALIEGRFFVSPEDVKKVALDVLRHRIKPTFEAEAEHLGTDEILGRLLERVDVP
jgi:MoxR-like ATPase